jgi:hypothetical protein
MSEVNFDDCREFIVELRRLCKEYKVGLDVGVSPTSSGLTKVVKASFGDSYTPKAVAYLPSNFGNGYTAEVTITPLYNFTANIPVTKSKRTKKSTNEEKLDALPANGVEKPKVEAKEEASDSLIHSRYV